MTERIGGYVPERFIDLEKVKEAMAENAKVRDAYEAGDREGFRRGLKQAPLWERRERIATAAMQGLIARHGAAVEDEVEVFTLCAKQSLSFADALMAALDAKPEDK